LERLADNPLVKPNGSLAPNPNGLEVEAIGSDRPRNFIIRVRLFNPNDRSEAPWDYGFFFRNDGKGYRLRVDSEASWNLSHQEGRSTELKTIASGAIPEMNVSSGGSNVLYLAVLDGSGLFYVNERLVATLDLSADKSDGYLFLVANALRGHGVSGKATRYEELKMWSLVPDKLDRIAGLTANLITASAGAVVREDPGLLRQRTDNIVATHFLKVSRPTRDFVIETEYFNPHNSRKVPWDYGFGFRNSDRGQFRIYVNSSKRWYLVYASGSGVTFKIDQLASGLIADLDVTPGKPNKLRLAVRDKLGLLFVNGLLVDSLDLSLNTSSGQIYIGTNFENGYAVEGRVTRYENVILQYYPSQV